MSTDCRSEDGVTIGLIDSLMAVSRVLAPRLKTIEAKSRWDFENNHKDVWEALDDASSDKDIQYVLGKYEELKAWADKVWPKQL